MFNRRTTKPSVNGFIQVKDAMGRTTGPTT